MSAKSQRELSKTRQWFSDGRSYRKEGKTDYGTSSGDDGAADGTSTGAATRIQQRLQQQQLEAQQQHGDENGGTPFYYILLKEKARMEYHYISP